MKPVDIHRVITVRSYTGATELHWHEGGKEQWMVLDGDIARHDWFTVARHPVRATKGVPRSSAISGQYFWSRTREYVWFESQEEKDVLMELEYEGDVLDVRSQPFAIVFSDDDSPLAWRVPDMLLRHRNGDVSVLDVRPADRIDERAAGQFRSTQEVLSRCGIGYQVRSAPRGVERENLRWIKFSRADRHRPPADAEQVLLEQAASGASRRALRMAVAPSAPPLANAWIDNLLWRRLLAMDMTVP